MATESDSSSTDHSPEVVGNAFVHQYFSILFQSPEHVHRFYQESSMLSRPGLDDAMTSVTTLKDINEAYVSFGYNDYRVEILTVDSQVSYKNGVIVLVTGLLIGKDDSTRKFTQSFFLAPQDKGGYFVLNDVFRFLNDKESPVVAVNDDDESAPAAPLTPDADATPVPDHDAVNHTTVPLEEEEDDEEDQEVNHPMDNGEVSALENGVKNDHPVVPSQNDVIPVSETVALGVQEDTPKKSYASIVHALKGNSAPFQVRLPPAKLPAKTEEKSRPAAAPEATSPTGNGAWERTNDHAVKGHSIFVANLPMNATVQQLEEVFKKFGPIKPDGVQVRSYKQKGNCFGFVEFESASSVQSAVEAAPILIGNRKADVEEKRANNDNRGKFPPGRGGFRNDNFRGRGNYNGGRNFSRNGVDRRGEFNGPPRGATGRNGDVAQMAKAELAVNAG